MTHFDHGAGLQAPPSKLAKTERGMKSMERPKEPPTLVLRGFPLSHTRPSSVAPACTRRGVPSPHSDLCVPHGRPGTGCSTCTRTPRAPPPPPQPTHLPAPPTPSASCPMLPSSYTFPHPPVQTSSRGCLSQGESERIPARGFSAPRPCRPLRGTPGPRPDHHPPAGPPGSWKGPGSPVRPTSIFSRSLFRMENGEKS